jgi:hypothetical protein
MRIKMHAETLRAGGRQIDIRLHRMQKHLFQTPAKAREWGMEFVELRNHQAAPRIMPGKQARQVNAAAFALQVFIGRDGGAALPPAIGHGHARMARGIGAQKRIQISNGKQARVKIRRLAWQKPPSSAFTQRKNFLRRQRAEGKLPSGFAECFCHAARRVSGPATAAARLIARVGIGHCLGARAAPIAGAIAGVGIGQTRTAPCATAIALTITRVRIGQTRTAPRTAAIALTITRVRIGQARAAPRATTIARTIAGV